MPDLFGPTKEQPEGKKPNPNLWSGPVFPFPSMTIQEWTQTLLNSNSSVPLLRFSVDAEEAEANRTVGSQNEVPRGCSSNRNSEAKWHLYSRPSSLEFVRANARPYYVQGSKDLFWLISSKFYGDASRLYSLSSSRETAGVPCSAELNREINRSSPAVRFSSSISPFSLPVSRSLQLGCPFVLAHCSPSQLFMTVFMAH